jgi:hypothetical protein
MNPRAACQALSRALVVTGVVQGWSLHGATLDPAFVESLALKFIFLAEGPADESWFRRMGGYAGLVASNKRCVAA